MTVLRLLRTASRVPGIGEAEMYSDIDVRMDEVWASIWLARTAGDGGRGTRWAIERARAGVRLVRAVEALEMGELSSLLRPLSVYSRLEIIIAQAVVISYDAP